MAGRACGVSAKRWQATMLVPLGFARVLFMSPVPIVIPCSIKGLSPFSSCTKLTPGAAPLTDTPLLAPGCRGRERGWGRSRQRRRPRPPSPAPRQRDNTPPSSGP